MYLKKLILIHLGGTFMKKKLIGLLSITVLLGVVSPTPLLAATIDETDIETISQTEFEALISEIEGIKATHPEYSEKEILKMMNILHPDNERGIFDIWNALTDSEKKLCIRYPFDALKVNKAKNIATDQTTRKFGKNGLGDRSDAFRHGIWNAEMTVLIGKEKAELFATAHEDKDVSGNEADGYRKQHIEIWIYIIMKSEEI